MRKLFSLSVLAAVAAAALIVVPQLASADPSRVIMKDDCDPVTFNAVVGPGTCVGNGTTTFFDFIGQLESHQFAGAWHFAPKQVNLRAGSSLDIENRGGETHTFTQTTSFDSAGIVPVLNQILGRTDTFFFGPPNFIPAGGSLTIASSTLTPGTHLFMCIIHPWMNETVRVS